MSSFATPSSAAASAASASSEAEATILTNVHPRSKQIVKEYSDTINEVAKLQGKPCERTCALSKSSTRVHVVIDHFAALLVDPNQNECQKCMSASLRRTLDDKCMAIVKVVCLLLCLVVEKCSYIRKEATRPCREVKEAIVAIFGCRDIDHDHSMDDGVSVTRKLHFGRLFDLKSKQIPKCRSSNPVRLRYLLGVPFPAPLLQCLVGFQHTTEDNKAEFEAAKVLWGSVEKKKLVPDKTLEKLNEKFQQGPEKMQVNCVSMCLELHRAFVERKSHESKAQERKTKQFRFKAWQESHGELLPLLDNMLVAAGVPLPKSPETDSAEVWFASVIKYCQQITAQWLEDLSPLCSRLASRFSAAPVAAEPLSLSTASDEATDDFENHSDGDDESDLVGSSSTTDSESSGAADDSYQSGGDGTYSSRTTPTRWSVSDPNRIGGRSPLPSGFFLTSDTMPSNSYVSSNVPVADIMVSNIDENSQLTGVHCAVILPDPNFDSGHQNLNVPRPLDSADSGIADLQNVSGSFDGVTPLLTPDLDNEHSPFSPGSVLHDRHRFTSLNDTSITPLKRSRSGESIEAQNEQHPNKRLPKPQHNLYSLNFPQWPCEVNSLSTLRNEDSELVSRTDSFAI